VRRWAESAGLRVTGAGSLVLKERPAPAPRSADTRRSSCDQLTVSPPPAAQAPRSRSCWAGTSGSSPVIAALEADAKHAVGHALGFANPLLYRLRDTAGIRDILPLRSPALVLSPLGNCAASSGVCLITESLDGSLHVRKGFDEVTGIGAATSQLVSAIRRDLGHH
jgi:hypothetical protein